MTYDNYSTVPDPHTRNTQTRTHLTSFGKVHSNIRGKLDVFVLPRLPGLQPQQHVGARDPAGVEPQLMRARHGERYPIVLKIVPANQNRRGSGRWSP